MRALFAMLLIAGCASAPLSSPSPIAGEWRINRRESDKTRKSVIEAIGIGQARGVARKQGEEPREAAERTALLRQRMQTTVHAPSRLEIRIEGTRIEILDAAQPLRSFVADGAPRRQTIAVEGDVESRAAWKDGALVTEMRTGDGMAITEAYQSAEAGTKLIVTVTIENPALEEPIVIRRLYERVR